MKIKELDSYIDRKHLLLRQIDNKYVKKEVAMKEIEQINQIISKKTQEVLVQESEKLRTEIKTVTKTVFTDGNFKRTVARVIIKFLQQLYEDDDIRGIMRQGYRIMRGKG